MAVVDLLTILIYILCSVKFVFSYLYIFFDFLENSDILSNLLC